MNKIVKLDFKALTNYLYWQAVSNSSGATHPKFSRRFVKPIRLFLYSLVAKFIATPSHSDINCDVLLLHRSEKSRKLGLRDHLVRELHHQSLNVIEAHTENNRNILKNRLLCPPPVRTPLSFLFFASYAYYIIKQYNPKVILTDSNGSTLSPFLKAFLPDDCKLVHIAHCVTTDNYRHYSLIDYDYYFLYGRSSLDKLRKRTILFGNCNVVLTGPYLADKRFSLKPGHANKKILLFGVNPNMEKRPHIQKTYAFIKKWINQHSDYQLFIKMHPRSTLDFWGKAQTDCKNIHMVSKGTSMQEALGEISITLAIYTNAVIDSALLNRPSLLVTDSTLNDELDLEQFFLPCSQNEDELNKNIEQILNNYSYYLDQTTGFAKYHLEHQQDSVEFIANCINSIVQGKESFQVEPLQGTPFLL